MVKKKEFDLVNSKFSWSGKELTFETGKLAVQADSSVEFTIGDNSLLFTTCMNKNPDEDMDFMPLMIDFRESYSAAGRIAGALYRRREGRPSDNNILYARMTDRALRPMFPKGMINDVVISITPLALDHEMELDVMTIIGSSLSVMMAGIPLDGPVGAVQIGCIDDEFIVNPTKEQIEKGTLNLLVAGKKGSINMIECGSNEISEDKIKEAFVLAQKEIDKICDIQNEFINMLNIEKKEIKINLPSTNVKEFISKVITQEKLDAMSGNGKISFNELYSQYEKEVLDNGKDLIEDEESDITYNKLKMGVFDHIKKFIRNRTIESGKRIDDRLKNEIRPLYTEIGLYPRNHGSGLFRRGETQVLSTTTLGGPSDYLLLDDMENDGTKKRYFHHYNFPPFSVGEAKGTRGQNRREIGHGKLAEKSLEPVLPNKEKFPYCIRVVSECMGSGGSTSMGSVCGSTLSLMDAGVPIKKPVAGIAMGLMSEYDENYNINKYVILDDLQGVEDFTGDMDFKVAGTKDGITAIQLDTKLKGLTMEIVHKTISRAYNGYNEIMDFMLQTINKPRDQVKEYAPKIHVFTIPIDKIKEVIGKGGDIINEIIEKCNDIKIDFDDDGTTYLAHQDQETIEKAKRMILDIVEDLEIGQIYEGEISRIENYGVFVKLPKNKVGLCHISDLGPKFGKDLNKQFKIGDKIKVKISEIDNQGRIKVKKMV